MSQDTEKYLYFNVGLLEDSFALEALRRDALKYHMVSQPGQLIALRLTEYYELMAGGVLPSVAGTPFSTRVAASSKRNAGEHMLLADSEDSASDDADTYAPDEERIIAASPDAEQNADEAAEYWARL